MRKPRRTHPVPLARIVPKVLGDLGFDETALILRIAGRWEEVAGVEGARHSRRVVVLEDRYGDDLVDHSGDELPQVRAIFSVVLRVVAIRNEIHLDERIGIVARDRIVSK